MLKSDRNITKDIRGDISDNAVVANGLWKIYGPHANEALDILKKEGLGKDEVLAKLGSIVGVADVSFSIPRGEIFCVMGLSGSGKSTLVRHINRLIEPTAGEIIINGHDIAHISEIELHNFSV